MTGLNTAVMVVRSSTSVKLMAPHANQLWSTEVGTRPWVNVTSTFMAPPTSIQPTSMKVRAPGHSVIHHFQLALWFFLSSMYSLLWTFSRCLLTSVGHLSQPPFYQRDSSSLVFASLPQFLLQSFNHAQRAWQTQKRANVLQLYRVTQP
jgi:hypothetical protein